MEYVNRTNSHTWSSWFLAVPSTVTAESNSVNTIVSENVVLNFMVGGKANPLVHSVNIMATLDKTPVTTKDRFSL